MEPTSGSGQERGLGQAATVAMDANTPSASICTPSLAADPTDVTPGIPHQEIDAVHPDLDAHRVQRAMPNDEVA
jgi:hypothetical protein